MNIYPTSCPVVPGQATEADQYNFLRNDALFFGAEAGTSGSLRDLLFQETGAVRLSRASKTSLRLEASGDAPCAMMIGGNIFSVSEDLLVNLTADRFPDPGRYFLYAAGNGDGSFTLTAGGSSSPSGSRRVGNFLWSGTGVIPGTVYSLSEWEARQRGADLTSACGRLTLVPGEPVPDTDIFLGETLYFTPYNGNQVGLYLGGSWEVFRFSELSLRLSGMMREIPYDVFLTADEDGLKLSVLSWGTSSARPSGMLTRVDGVRVSGGDSGRRYLGTIALNASGYGEDSCSGRLVWNENHRVSRPLLARLSTRKGQGLAHMGSWAPYFDEDAPSLRILVPSAEADFTLNGVGISSMITETDAGYNRAAAIGICRDMMTESPYTGNENCAAAFTHTCGKSPVTVSIRNLGGSFLGCHRYTLAFWSNYTYYPTGTSLSAGCGECPGLWGSCMC